jgi:branched-chain amino acid aminotransferase
MPVCVNINGVITAPEEAKISVFDHGFLFGDSVYETLRTYRQKPFLFSRHFARLERSAAGLYMPVRWSREEMRLQVDRTLDAAQNPGDSRIRIVLTRGIGQLTADPDACTDPNLIIIVAPLVELPPATYSNGIDVVLSTVRRVGLIGEIKSSSLIHQVIAYREAKLGQAGEAILMTADGHLSDGTSSNVYLVRDRVLMTPSRDAHIVEGITRGALLELARGLGLETIEGLFEPGEIRHAEEMFLTSTTREIVPIVRVGGKPVGNGKPGKWTLRLLEAYRNAVDYLLKED